MSEFTEKITDPEDFLDSIPKFSKTGSASVNFDLDRMKNLCERLGNPQKSFKSIHVGGTNGKGTVCRMLASVYQEAGYKVGLYTSPHLLNVRERFRVNSRMMSSEVFSEFFDLHGVYIHNSQYTYFEITTAIAFWFFSKENVDIAIVEVGLGGRLDATNVVNPLVSVITSVGMDHTDILGGTLEAIAFEKAGIIKNNTPLVIGNLPPEAGKVIQSAAASKKADVINGSELKPEFEHQKIVLNGIKPPLVVDGTRLKKIDALNVAIIYQIVVILDSVFPVLIKQVVEGIEKIHDRFSNHGVFEKLRPDEFWFFDGAHNVESVETLINHLIYVAPAGKWLVVLSFMKDKLNKAIADLWNNFPEIYLYKMEGERAASLVQMKDYFPSARVIEDHDFLQSDHFKSELVIFSGSFYFYSIVSNWMGALASADQK